MFPPLSGTIIMRRSLVALAASLLVSSAMPYQVTAQRVVPRSEIGPRPDIGPRPGISPDYGRDLGRDLDLRLPRDLPSVVAPPPPIRLCTQRTLCHYDRADCYDSTYRSQHPDECHASCESRCE
jgi:hypothetical protein